MTKKIVLHIGTHKTGSTSLQQFLLDNAARLGGAGVHLYRGQFHQANHIELYLAAMRYDRDSFAKQRLGKRIRFDAAFTDRVADRVHNAIRSCSEPCVLFTCEGLSLLRHDDEIDRLISILGTDHLEVRVILYLREKMDFLRSYSRQLLKVDGRAPTSDYWSALNVQQDTWLTDYESLIRAYQTGFGEKSLTVIDYDGQLQREGNIIPSFLRALEIDSTGMTDVSSYFRNVSNHDKKKNRTGRWAQRANLAWQKWTRRRSA